MELKPGDKFGGRYQLLSKLGSLGLGSHEPTLGIAPLAPVQMGAQFVDHRSGLFVLLLGCGKARAVVEPREFAAETCLFVCAA
jgi:hypothetical protein